jgi:hypothetical protein
MLAYFMASTTTSSRREKYNRLRRLCRQKRSKWVKSGRTESWWMNMITGIAQVDEWKRNFRMTREEFRKLCEELRPHISPGKTPNYLALSVEKKVNFVAFSNFITEYAKIFTCFLLDCLYVKPQKLNTIVIFIQTGGCNAVLFKRHWINLDDCKHFGNSSMHCL